MPTPIRSETIKAIRSMKRWTQEQLAEATRGKHKVGLATIKRIEGAKTGSYDANDRVAEGLAKALGVPVQTLSKPQLNETEREGALRNQGLRPLRTMIDEETAFAFNLVQQIYGIPVQSQILMAPLFAALIAEASLAWRRDKAVRIDVAAREVSALATGHLAAARAADHAVACAAWELSRIAKRDLFCRDAPDEAFELGYDPTQGNPFADFLAHFTGQVEARTIEIAGGGNWKTREGMPRYRIGAELVAQATARDPEAYYALVRGHVRLPDIPADLMEPGRTADRVAWIVARIPEPELAQIRSRLDRVGKDISPRRDAPPSSAAAKAPHLPREKPDA